MPLPFGDEVEFSVLEKDRTLLIDDTKWRVLESHSKGEAGADIKNLGVEAVSGRFRINQLSAEALKHGQAGELFVLTHSGLSQTGQTHGLLMRVNPEMKLNYPY